MKVRFLFIFFLAFVSLAAQDVAGEDYDDDDFFDDDYILMEGGGLTIVGALNTTQQMDVVDRETIEKIHAPDLHALLEEALGLGVNRRGPYGNEAGVNIRGFDIKRIAVLVDGAPVNSASSGNFDFYSIDPLSIERIEVIYGGSDTKFNVSGALGGVINIVTVRKNRRGWQMGGSISNTSYLPGRFRTRSGTTGDPQWSDLADSQNIRVFGAYGAERYSFNLSVFGNRVENHFLYRDNYNYTRRKEGNEILDGGVTASLVRNIGDYAKFIAAGSFYLGEKNLPVSGYASNSVEQRDTASRENLMLDMPRAFHDDFAMELSVNHNWKKLHFGAASLHNENDITLINRWSWYPGTKFTLRFGGDYRFINLDSTNTGLHQANRGGLYVTPEFSPARNLLFIASVKGITDGRDLVPIPKLGWSWSVNNNVTLKNNYFRSFKFPDFDDLYWVQEGMTGNPDLKNEDGWGADFGADFLVKDLLSINSTLYGEWTDNSIHWSNISGKWRPENYGTAAFLGWDNSLRLTIPFSPGILEKPVLSISWFFQMSWLLTGDLSFEDDKRIPYMPVHTLGASLELPWKTTKNKLPGSFAVSGRFEGPRYADTANYRELAALFLLNFAVNQKLNNNINIIGKLNNALNTRYFSYIEYPMPGISLTAGLRMEFEGSTGGDY